MEKKWRALTDGAAAGRGKKEKRALKRKRPMRRLGERSYIACSDQQHVNEEGGRRKTSRLFSYGKKEKRNNLL